jgi:hypothetical protein
VLGQLPPFEAAGVWWADAAGVVAGVRERHGVDVTVLRLLSTELPVQPGGAVTVLAEVEQAAGLDLAPFAGELLDHPLRQPYAEVGGPARDLAWAAERLEERGLRLHGRPDQVRTWNLSSLWRLPLEEGSAWLKCVPSFFAHEGAVLHRLQAARYRRCSRTSPGGCSWRRSPVRTTTRPACRCCSRSSTCSSACRCARSGARTSCSRSVSPTGGRLR